MSENIMPVNLSTQFRKDYQRYALYVTRKRAVPDAKDGQKPGQRLILYCMFNDSNAIKHRVKSSAVVGRVMEKYHPHGDTAIYNTMKPMANWFESYMPLVSPQGNFGSIQGDGAAAARYTEVKLTNFCLDAVIGDLVEAKESCDWVMNYSESCLQPEYLPTKVPILLVNGVIGIGVGLKLEIPPHNLNEVIDATLNLLRNPDAPVVLAPDCVMPCEIIDTNFKAISNKGIGAYTTRGIIDIEQYSGPNKRMHDRVALVIKTLPNLTFLDTIVDKIEKLILENKLPQIQHMIDESEGGVLRYVIILKKGSDPNYVKSVIYNSTGMEKVERINFEILDGLELRRFSYKSYLEYFIEFRKNIKFRLYCNKLQDIRTKIHEYEMYVEIGKTGKLDDIILAVRRYTSPNKGELIEHLVTSFGLTDIQSAFIVNNGVDKLSEGNIRRYAEELVKYKEEDAKILPKVLDDNLLVDDIINELEAIKRKYGGKRRCKIISMSEASNIPAGDFKVVVTENNFIKKVSPTEYIGNNKGDSPKIILVGENSENIMIFDEKGTVFGMKIHAIPFAERGSNGTDIRILLKKLTSNINTVMYEPRVLDLAKRLNNKFFMVVVTTKGLIKKMDLDDFQRVLPGGLVYTKLDPDDTVKDVKIISERSDIIVFSHSKAIRLKMDDIPYLKRSTKGSKAMNTDENVDGLSVIRNDATDIIVITASGKINRFSPLALSISSRGKAGKSIIKLSKGDYIKYVFSVVATDTIRVVTETDKIMIPVNSIPEGSSISAGTKMINTKSDVIVRCDVIKN